MGSRLIKGLIASATLAFASGAFADYDFSAADQKYFARGNGRSSVDSAAQEYEKALAAKLTVEEKV